MDLGVSLYRKENWAEATMVLQYEPAVLVSLFPESEASMIPSCIEVTACFYLCTDQSLDVGHTRSRCACG